MENRGEDEMVQFNVNKVCFFPFSQGNMGSFLYMLIEREITVIKVSGT